MAHQFWTSHINYPNRQQGKNSPQDKQFCKSSHETNEGQNEIQIKWNSTKIESQFPWSPNLDYFLQDLGDNENNNY